MTVSTRKILIALLLSLPQILAGQKNEKFIGMGWGYLQGINISANYFYTENMSIGLGAGSHFGLPPLQDEKQYSITLENRFQFGTPYENRMKPWTTSNLLDAKTRERDLADYFFCSCFRD